VPLLATLREIVLYAQERRRMGSSGRPGPTDVAPPNDVE
jgi:hypothetical protein